MTLFIYTSRCRKPKSIFYSSLLPNLERQELITWRFGGLLVAQGGGPSLLNAASVYKITYQSNIPICPRLFKAQIYSQCPSRFLHIAYFSTSLNCISHTNLSACIRDSIPPPKLLCKEGLELLSHCMSRFATIDIMVL